ncbi:MAG: alpha/beta hydrolase, partial [Pseudomonas sp.]|nr:alpha/beta hydrolase [Pseudomonas sp.]
KAIIKRVLRLAGLSKQGSFTRSLISDALAGKPGQYLKFTQAVLNWNVSSQVSGLKTRVLLIWGQNDLIMPLRIGKLYQNKLANAELTVIEEVGHTPHLENPEVFSSVLADFIEQCINQ